MVKSRWGRLALALAFVGIPAIAQAEGNPGLQPGIAVSDTSAVAEQMTQVEQEPPPPSPMGRVERASFTSEVVAREPQDSIESLSNENTQIIFFTEVHGAQGQTVFHVWEREGAEVARVAFDVGGSRWRIYSTKNLEPSWLGEWNVRVEDADGRELHHDSFSYVATGSPTDPEKTSAAATSAAAKMLPPHETQEGSHSADEQSVTPDQQPPANAP